jgi:double-strand break repair protein MRE11
LAKSRIQKTSCNITASASPPRRVRDRFLKLADSISEAKVNADAPEMKDEGEDDEDERAMTTRDRLNKLRMADLVQQHLKAQSLEVLVEGGLEDAVMRFVEKDDRDAIKEFVHYRFQFSTDPHSFVASALKSVGKQMRGQDIDEEDVEQRVR